MASRAVEKEYLQEYLFKETLSKLVLFRRNSGDNIEEHITTVKKFIDQFGKHNLITDDEKIVIFLKYFDADIIKEVCCQAGINEEKSIGWYEEKFIKLLEKKRSKTSIIVDIISDTKQEREESVVDFAKRIKMKCISYEGDKEKLMLHAFMEGIYNRSVAIALRISGPKTIDEAVEEVKCEYTAQSNNDEDYQLRKVTSTEQGTINYLKREIERLKKIIEELRGAKTENRIVPERREIICYNCNETGHFAKYCKIKREQTNNESRTCYKCGRRGHIAVNCRRVEDNKERCRDCGGRHLSRYCDKKNKFRYIQEEYSEDEISQSNKSCLVEEEKCIDSMAAEWTKERTDSVKENLRRNDSIEEKYVNFINGNGARPKQILKSYEPTLISVTRKEKAKNKPITVSHIGNKEVKVMFDTGANLNVISEELIKDLIEKNPSIKIYDSKTRVTCANGSSVQCTGKVQLSVAIGPILTSHVFDIMPNIFPHLYIGIRSMKKYEIMVNTAKDCIEIQGIEIPFLSKTRPASSLN